MKKNLLLFFLFFVCMGYVSAQTKDDPWGVNIFYTLNNYAENGTHFKYDFEKVKSGLSLGGTYFLSKHFNGVGDLGLGFFDNESTIRSAFFDVSLLAEWKPLGLFGKESPLIEPYLTTGIGYGAQDNDDSQVVPYGGGLRIILSEGLKLHLKTNMVHSFTRGTHNYLQSRIGLTVGATSKEPLSKDKDGDGVMDDVDLCPKEYGSMDNNGCPLPTDGDGDGISDEADECPNEAGTAAYNGCPAPDKDGDGVMDENDNCPDIAGVASLNGCPDSDGDGVSDNSDACPRIAGLAELNGCPDSDGDGIVNAQDNCPNEAGPASRNGCPEITEEEVEKVERELSMAARHIQFESGKDILKKSSTHDLKELVKIMQDHPYSRFRIEGHTDNTGGHDLNQQLSSDRSNAVKQYFTDRGVEESRLEASGFGEDSPIADNGTAKGRELNRRVEIHLIR